MKKKLLYFVAFLVVLSLCKACVDSCGDKKEDKTETKKENLL